MANESKKYCLPLPIVILFVLVSTDLSFGSSIQEYNQTLTSERVGKTRTISHNKQPMRIVCGQVRPVEDAQKLLSYPGMKDPQSQYIAEALARIPPDLRASLPCLRELADGQDAEMRLSVAVVLSRVKPTAPEALPILITLLNDSNPSVLNEALSVTSSYKEEATIAIPSLMRLLSNRDADTMVGAANALGQIGPGARASISSLELLARSRNDHVRIAALEALSKIEPVSAVPYLIESLNDPALDVRLAGITTLRLIGQTPETEEAIPRLITLATRKDAGRNTNETSNAIAAITRIKPDAREVIPVFTALLRDPADAVRRAAAHGLTGISDRLLKNEAVEAVELLESAYDLMVMSHDSEVRNESVELRIRLDKLTELRLSKLRELRLRRFRLFVSEHLFASAILCLYILFILLSLVAYAVFPLLFLLIKEKLADLKVPKFVPLIGGFDVPLSHVFAIGFFPYGRFVLDAWVNYHLETAQRLFSERDTVKANQEHIPLPILLDGEKAENYNIHAFESIFSHNLNCLLIRGEGGSGKTSFACFLATWAMNENKSKRLWPRHVMLPVLIDHTLELHTRTGREEFLKIINNQIKGLLDLADAPSPRLLLGLLKHRRILVIVDGFSETDKTTRKIILDAINDTPIGAIIITSRNDENLGSLRKNTVRLLRLSGSHVPTFIEQYLENRKKQRLFEGEKLMEVSRRLMLMVGQSGITTVLAKYYVELRIAAEENLTVANNLPSNIPDLMQRYIDIIHRDQSADSPSSQEIHNVAEIAAWCCLRRTYRAAATNYKDILAALGRRANGFGLLIYLRDPLRIIQADGTSYDRIRFVLDPLAEYLAGIYITKRCGSRIDLWQDFLRKADEQDGTPKTIRSFLMAVQDCCISNGAEAKIPDFVNVELTKRVIMAFVQDLKSSEPDIREEAAKLLGDMRQDAIGVLDHLTAVLSDKHDSVRLSAEIAIAKIRSAES
jgi:HEAT repeat protein